jgi:hypothetical protein
MAAQRYATAVLDYLNEPDDKRLARVEEARRELLGELGVSRRISVFKANSADIPWPQY